MIHTGVVRGDVVEPRNESSMLDAQGAGVFVPQIRVGFVSARVHLEAVPPVLVDVFGDRWFSQGSVSLWFESPTVDGEPTQVVAHRSGGRDQVEVRIERPDGSPVAIGTAAVGEPDEVSELERRFLVGTPDRPRRILAGVEPGDRLDAVTAVLDGTEQRRRLADAEVLGPLPWYDGDSPWGGPIATPHTEVSALAHIPTTGLRNSVEPTIVYYRAVELRHRNGPLLLDRAYRFGAQVIDVGATDDAEMLWLRSWADDTDGRRIAEVTLLARLVPDPAGA
ncbi:MAG TPA: hypothetical protein VK866_13145 [Acidimicrobiales bacterium]|nr:hypothetical protein [Acidimicrobiales bacterium]